MTPLDVGDLRSGRDKLVRATNAQQKAMVQAYDTWAAKLERELLQAAGLLALPHQVVGMVDRSLPMLEAKLVEINHEGALTAQRIIAGRGQPSSRVMAATAEGLQRGDEAISAKLVPFIGGKVKEVLATGSPLAGLAKKEVAAALDAQRLYPAYTAGNFWAMLFDIMRAKGQDEDVLLRAQGQPPARVWWVLDPTADHCSASTGFYGCPDLAGEYPGGWDTLPTLPAGHVVCRYFCRCSIEIWRDGQWS